MPPKPPWTYDRVLDCKARLVELLARRTEAFSVKPRSAEEKCISSIHIEELGSGVAPQR